MTQKDQKTQEEKGGKSEKGILKKKPPLFSRKKQKMHRENDGKEHAPCMEVRVSAKIYPQ